MIPVEKSTRAFALFHAIARVLGKVRVARFRLGLSEEQRYEAAAQAVRMLQEDGRWPELSERSEREVQPFPSLDSKTRNQD